MKKKLLLFIGLILASVTVGLNRPNVYAQENQLEQIKSKGVLTVGTSGDYPPFEFYAEINGKRQLVGMDVLIAQQIANDLGVEVQIEDMSFDSLLAALEAGQIDMILSGMTPTEERRESVAFSDPYFDEKQSVLMKSDQTNGIKSQEDLVGMTIGVQSGSLQEVLVDQIDTDKVLTLTNINDLVLALNTGRADAILTSQATSDLWGHADETLSTVPLEFEDDDEGMAVAIRPGQEELLAAVNKSVEQMHDQGQAEKYYEESLDLFVDFGEANMQSQEDNSFLSTYAPYFWEGTKLTLFISVVSVFFGLILGFVLAVMRLSQSIILKGLATTYVEFIRGTPLMIQVMFIYFGSGTVYPLPALTAGILAVSLNSGAYICEIIRSGLSSVDLGQSEAARSLGMSKSESMRHIIFPQALKIIWPSLGNEFITIIKESSIVSVIGVSELIFQSRVVRSISFEGILPLFVTMVIYFILTFFLTKLLNYMEGRMNYDHN